MQRVIERTEQNTISVRTKNNIYYEARISLKIGGGKSERFQKGGKAQDKAVLKLLEKVETFINTITTNRTITFKINPNLPNLLMKSINNLQITDQNVIQKALSIINTINRFNASFDNVIIENTNILSFPTLPNNINPAVNTYLINNYCDNQVLESATQEYKKEILDNFEDFAYEWIAYKFSLCKKTPENPVPKSRKTMERLS